MCNKREYLHFILDLLFSICGNQVLSVASNGVTAAPVTLAHFSKCCSEPWPQNKH